MAKCPHNCSRCRAVEAGFGNRALTPQEFMEVFGVVEVDHERAPLAEDTLEASAAVEVARIAYDVANHDVEEIVFKADPRDADYEDALVAAAGERSEAGARLQTARSHLHALVRRDQEVWRAERAAVEQQARKERLAAERDANRRKAKGRLRSRLGRGGRRQ